jgi:hypothetical protein
MLLVPAVPAHADAPVPTDVRSMVEAIDPPADAVDAEIVGGDSFLRLRVEPGHEVVVAGYEGEPYLRFGRDGGVAVNRRSPAAFVNESRFGREPPPEADAAARPEWDEVAAGGSYAWHDHRTHWMATSRPDPPLRSWAVPITVDGEAATIAGVYRYEAPPSAWAWWVVAGLLAAAGGLLAWRRPGWLAWVIAISGAAVTAYGVELSRLPGGTGGTGGATVALGAVAVVCAVLSSLRRWAAGPLLAGSGIALLVAGWRHVDVLDHSVLTTTWPEALERLVVSSALGLGAVASVVGLAQSLGVYQPSGTRRSASSGPHDPRAYG